MFSRFVVSCCLVGAVAGAASASASWLSAAAPSDLGGPTARQGGGQFRITTRDFWLNLHSFLYVLGRAQNGTPDRLREAVVHAPDDVTRALGPATDADRAVWKAAVDFYAAGPSTRDVVFDAPLVDAATALSRIGDASDLEGVSATVLPADWRATLERAAPVYRRLFWAEQLRANNAWADEVSELVAQHGDAIEQRMTRAFGQPWPKEGFPVHVCAYTNWAGAFSTGDHLLLLASENPSTKGTEGLETIFHEAAHQLDPAIHAMLVKASEAQGVPIPRNLEHALIFYTAGDSVRREIPSHVPYTDATNMWPRLGPDLKTALDAGWRPFLDGKGTREGAVAETLRKARATRQR
jgi:hypothetical protein